MKIIPYIEIDGSRTVKDSIMIRFFEHIRGDGNLEKIFWRHPIINIQQWMAFCKSPENLFLTTWNDQERPVMVVWLNEFYKKSAFIHYYTISGPGYKEKIDAGQQTLKFLSPHLNWLIGMIPEYFPRAISFARLVGFKETGYIPGIFGDKGLRILAFKGGSNG